MNPEHYKHPEGGVIPKERPTTTAASESELNDLLCCGLCGSPVTKHSPDWGSVTEYCGVSDQSVTVGCSGEKSKHCPVSVDISVDADVMRLKGVHGSDIEKIACSAWNELAKVLAT